MKVLLIDSHNMLHRARYGFGEGEHKIYFNFFRMLMGELKLHNPDVVYVVNEGSPQQSLALQADYKGNRTQLEDPQFNREKREVFDAIKSLSGFVYIKHPHFECDDVIGQLANVVHKDDDVTIVSSDSDFIQCLTDKVKIWHPIKKVFLEKWPVDYITWKALKGDPTDNVPGVAGVGEKNATKLASDYEQLEKFLNSVPERRTQFETCKKIIKLKEVPLDSLEVIQNSFDETKLLEEFTLRKFKSIIGKSWPKWVVAFNNAGGKNAFK